MNAPVRVILIQPETGLLSEIKSRPSYPMSVVSAARDLAGDCRITLIDQRVENRWRKRLQEALREEPACVGITSITGGQLHHALEAGRLVKATAPDVPVVWGGVHVTLLPEQSLEEPSIDIVVRGEGEETFPDLVRHLVRQEPLCDVPGISYCENGEIVRTASRGVVDLDRLSPMPYSLAGADYLFLRRGRPSMYLETSRGCPYRCAFCYQSSVEDRGWRSMSPPGVMQSVEEILRVFPKTGHLSIVDDNFFVDLGRVREICRLLIEARWGLSYQIQGAHIRTVKSLREEDLTLLRESGCERLDMGVESGSEAVLGDIDKGIRPEDVRVVNRRLEACGIEPWFNFMTGFPSETEEDLRDTLRLVVRILQENREALISPLYCFTPYPGSKLYEQSLEMGFEPPAHIEDWVDYVWDRARFPWVSRGKAKELEALYFLSIFIDRKFFEYSTRWWIAVAAVCYKPIARFRFRYRILGWMVEMWIFRRLFGRKDLARGKRGTCRK